MIGAHLGTEELELYAIGAGDQVDFGDVEAHLRVCETCTEEVRRQARLDDALSELAQSTRFCPGCEAILLAPRCAACGAVAYVNGYSVDRVLVQNAHGRVYLAHDEAGQAVALKELAFVQAPHPDVVASFEREARLLRQLSHPQIPKFRASFREGEGVAQRLYLAQEFVQGESLLARLERHQFSEAEAIEIADQVLAILEYLQALSPMVFHRDIKPTNLIRKPNGQIALVDFGAARDLGATVGATLVGTFGYMPIEQLGGIVDATTDPHALGATLAHLLSRREPWKFLEDPAALTRLNVSPPFRAFIAKLMAPRRPDRFPSAAAARAALHGLGHTRSMWPRVSLPRWPLLVGAATLALGFSMTLLMRASSRHRIVIARRPPTPDVSSMTSDIRKPKRQMSPPSLPRNYWTGNPKELRRALSAIEEQVARVLVSPAYARGVTKQLEDTLLLGKNFRGVEIFPVATFYFIVSEAGLGHSQAGVARNLVDAYASGLIMKFYNLPAYETWPR